MLKRTINYAKEQSFSVFALIGCILLIFGGWCIINMQIENNEDAYFSKMGQTYMYLPEQENEIKNEEEKDSFSGKDLSESEIEQLVKVWKSSIKEIPHEPLPGQMNMEQAIETGKEWISMIASDNILFSADSIQDFDKITAKLCMVDHEGLSDDMVSFWNISYKNEYVRIILKIHALSGNIWDANFETEEDKLTYDVSDKERLSFVFSFIGHSGNQILTEGPYTYRKIGKGSLFCVMKRSDIKINNNPAVISYHFYLSTSEI